MATSNKTRLATEVMLDIEDEVSTDSLMITWRFSISPTVADGIIFINLIHFSTNGEFPELVIIVLVNF